MAQEVRWLDTQKFAIGRWDGTLTVFHLPTQPNAGPTITSAAVSPASSGVEMIANVTPDFFASSIDGHSIALWEKNTIHQCTGIPFSRVNFDPKSGVANCGVVVSAGSKRFLVTGHAEGSVLIWEILSGPPKLGLVTTVDVRSPDPIPSSYRLWNVREIAPVGDGLAISGSEDGDLCVIAIPEGTVRTRMRYSATAQRGINDLSVLDDHLVVANCSVGSADKNLWLYRVDGTDLKLLDSKNLKTDPAAPQTFNFTVELATHRNGLVYFSATEEGLLWVGDIQQDRLLDGVTTPVSSHFGAALNFEPSQSLLAVAGDNIHLYQLT
jgi:WD40 repeat protein